MICVELQLLYIYNHHHSLCRSNLGHKSLAYLQTGFENAENVVVLTIDKLVCFMIFCPYGLDVDVGEADEWRAIR
jgi:hypothetical protein